MKNLLCLFAFLFLIQSQSFAQYVIDLESPQSMCITGKGPGQDGAINPYINEKSIAIVKSMDKNGFEVRIEREERIIKISKIEPNKTKEFVLEKGDVLYFDSNSKAKTSIAFKKFKE